jgi:hypothetical protein
LREAANLSRMPAAPLHVQVVKRRVG